MRVGTVLALCLATATITAAPGQERTSPPAPPSSPDADRGSERARLLELEREAAELLGRAAANGGPPEAKHLLAEAARRFEALAAGGGAGAKSDLLTAELRDELRRAAAELKGVAQGAGLARFSPDGLLKLLGRVSARLKGRPPLGLEFQGSYSQTKVAEPSYGGHASAMGPPPATAPRDTASGPSPATFEDVPVPMVKTHCGGPTKDHILESGGSGVAVFDYDGDGRPDIYLVNAYELTPARDRVPHRNALYRNLGDWRFEDVSARAGVDLAAWGSGACAGDFDDDGALDLYVTNWGANVLFRNRGDGTFVDVARAAGVEAGGWSTGCTFFDADGDEDLDLYVVRYVGTTWDDLAKAQRTLTWRGGPKVMVGPVGLPGEADLFYENEGDGTFAERTEAHGLADPARGYGFGVVATDYDDDGSVDLFVANDTTPNFLYRNLGRGRFESVGLASGVALNGEGRAQAGMGVDSGDYDGDGRLDLVVTNFAHDTNTLHRGVDGGVFEDATLGAGLAGTFVPMGWGTAFFDADLDGDLDLFFANGHIHPNVDEFPALKETFRQQNTLLLNEGGRFVDASNVAGRGLQVRKASRGLATGDLDGDGDLDLVVSNMDDVPTLLRNEQQTGHHWIGVRLRKSGGNRFAIGARVAVTAGGRTQVREVRSGGSYVSQHDLAAHFGLGSDAGPVDVEVRLPGGARWRWTKLPIDRAHLLSLKKEDRLE